MIIYELPHQLKDLYKHWQDHTTKPEILLSPEDIFEDEKLYREMKWFIEERINIWKKKTSGKKEPLTEDEILSTYRFTNIFREFDRQTIEFHLMLEPLRENFPLWLLNMFYCRMIARTNTIKYSGLLSFSKQTNEKVYENLINCPRPKFGTPYVFPISVIQRSSNPTREKFAARYLPSIMEEVAQKIQKWEKKNIFDGITEIIPIFGYNLRFLWTETMIDIAYQFPHLIDLFGKFPIGPGAKPTFKRINNKMSFPDLAVKLSQIKIDPKITYKHRPLHLSAENWEGIACEFRKYSNLKMGSGRKRLYKN